MKYNVLLFLTFAFLLLNIQPAAAVLRPVEKTADTEVISPADMEKAEKEWKEMSRKERKEVKKQFRKDLKKAAKNNQAKGGVGKLLLIIIAVLAPPIAMLLYDGLSGRFWLSLLLTILFYLPGLIYTLVVILED